MRKRFEGVVTLPNLGIEHAFHIDAGKIVLIGQPGDERLVIFRCPCGCGEYVLLHVEGSEAKLPPGTETWKLEVDREGRVSLSPSVVVTTCGAHFFIKHNEVR